jgi:hypothetical protein
MAFKMERGEERHQSLEQFSYNLCYFYWQGAS